MVNVGGPEGGNGLVTAGEVKVRKIWVGIGGITERMASIDDTSLTRLHLECNIAVAAERGSVGVVGGDPGCGVLGPVKSSPERVVAPVGWSTSLAKQRAFIYETPRIIPHARSILYDAGPVNLSGLGPKKLPRLILAP